MSERAVRSARPGGDSDLLATAYDGWAEAARGAGRPADAERVLREALDRLPDRAAHFHLQLGRHYHDGGRPVPALEHLARGRSGSTRPDTGRQAQDVDRPDSPDDPGLRVDVTRWRFTMTYASAAAPARSPWPRSSAWPWPSAGPRSRTRVNGPTPGPKKVPNAAAHRPTPLPDRIILTWQTDPATSQAVTWRTDTTVRTAVAEIAVAEDSAAFAGYGKAKGQARTRRVPAVTTPLKTDLNEAHCHSVNFTGLSPDTKYLYRVGDGANWSEWLEFKTAVAGPAPFTFLYFGDAQNDIKSHWSRVIRRAFADAPDARFLLHAGDLINTANSDAEWGEWFAAGGWVNGMVPSVPTPGNHEWFDSAAPPPRKLSKEEKAKAGAQARPGPVPRGRLPALAAAVRPARRTARRARRS